MPRTKKLASERLNDSINVPVSRPLKRRVMALADRQTVPIAHTKLARKFLEEGVARAERNEVANGIAPAGRQMAEIPADAQ